MLRASARCAFVMRRAARFAIAPRATRLPIAARCQQRASHYFSQSSSALMPRKAMARRYAILAAFFDARNSAMAKPRRCRAAPAFIAGYATPAVDFDAEAAIAADFTPALLPRRHAYLRFASIAFADIASAADFRHACRFARCHAFIFRASLSRRCLPLFPPICHASAILMPLMPPLIAPYFRHATPPMLSPPLPPISPPCLSDAAADAADLPPCCRFTRRAASPARLLPPLRRCC